MTPIRDQCLASDDAGRDRGEARDTATSTRQLRNGLRGAITATISAATHTEEDDLDQITDRGSIPRDSTTLRGAVCN